MTAIKLMTVVPLPQPVAWVLPQVSVVYQVLAVAVCAVADEPVTPCGGCRQKLREFAADDCPVWVADMKGQRASHTLGALLPHGFGPVHLGGAEST